MKLINLETGRRIQMEVGKSRFFTFWVKMVIILMQFRNQIPLRSSYPPQRIQMAICPK